ncbi:MAG: nicotinate (nicotinamide) nucleotide adenylyltransferase [Gemmatimonadetes bacterium]|nr:nicotinate (nicotinamide) nucleotide adenylyltransferase [Gemmatimonadota bacterium]
MRAGVFGGTFDPPHVGHLLVALDAADQLGLDRLVWVPAAVQPFKADAAVTDAAHRQAMTALVVATDPRFTLDAVEIERGGLSYTVDTLRTLRAREPGLDWVLCVGADAFRDFPRWREPAAIAAMATVAVLARAGTGADPDALAAVPGAVEVPVRRVDVSSTEVRARVRAGRSVQGFVTEPVAAYIAAHGLYR